MSMIIGMFSVLSIIEIQAAFGLITIFVTPGNMTIDADVEGFAVLQLLFWWIRDTHLICQHWLLYVLDDTDVPPALPWLDSAPYLPDGGCY